MNRRTLLKMSAAAALLPRISLPADSAQRANLPAEVAGIRLPQSDLALAAATSTALMPLKNSCCSDSARPPTPIGCGTR